MKEQIIRKQYLDKIGKFYKKPLIKVITGMRRTGKSTFLKQVFTNLKEREFFSENNFFYVNKELLEFDFIKDYNDLNIFFIEWKNINKIGNKFVIGIDEIQIINGWEKFVNSILAEYGDNIEIFITGSNSEMLSSELSTLISGRYIELHILPLTFKEFVNYDHIEKSIDKLFLKYIKFGGLPGIINFGNDEEIIYEYLRGIYNTIFVKDILAYNSIKNSVFFEKLYKYLFRNVGTIFNAQKIRAYTSSNSGTKISVDTIINYIKFGIKSFIIYEVNRYMIKGKNIFQINNKYYSGDIGIRNALSGFNFKQDIGNILENIVFLELKSRGYNVTVGILGDLEIDFVAEKNGELIYFQVAYLLLSEDTSKREFGNLLKIKDNWPKYVLTMDDFFETKYEGIIHKNIKDWLIGK
ncbi:MAG: ATP-binding protein [Candidatus Gracilibacteria bacterium]|nr:ATP-binding protein [Candidatus Gracilibacteria bacterium]MDQ7023098.1 ATP-binding protein [Candidatus Gracilibacteria bacterium]